MTTEPTWTGSAGTHLLGDALKSADEAELIRLATSEGELCGDAMFAFFENHCPGDDWCGMAEEATRLHGVIEESLGFPVYEYLIDALTAAVAAEAYHRGLRNAARYLGVPLVDLDNGVSEMVDDERVPLTGVVIPEVRYD